MRSAVARTLKTGKRSLLGWAKRAGAFGRVADSEWRRRRLLILCYHGVALEDEHLWNGPLYMSPSDLRARFELLRAGGYNVLPLDEALQRLYVRDLPPRSVTLTFDDGYHDFYAAAWPLLQEFGYPATVYLTTLRCGKDVPIFNLAVPYMLWKQRGRAYDGGAAGLGSLDLRTAPTRAEAWEQIQRAARGLNLVGKHELAQAVSDAIGADYAGICARRLLTIMTPEQVSKLSARGLDVQLHTHRHWTPQVREKFEDEIVCNRERIVDLTGRNPVHFCYPSGLYKREFLPWLSDLDVVSATTCDPGFATERSEALLLPRLIDHDGLSALEFEGWLSGASAFTARKAAAYRRSAAPSRVTSGVLPGRAAGRR